MYVLFFVSSEKKLQKNLFWIKKAVHDGLKFSFISHSEISNCLANELEELGASFIYTDSLTQALSEASGLLQKKADQDDVLLTTGSVVPEFNWLETLSKEVQEISNLGSCFGRWYKSSVSSRYFVSNENLGSKFKDSTPAYIANSVVNYSLGIETHAIQVSRAPIFFNWFSSNIYQELTEALQQGRNFADFMRTFSDTLAQKEGRPVILYLPKIETIDLRLL